MFKVVLLKYISYFFRECMVWLTTVGPIVNVEVNGLNVLSVSNFYEVPKITFTILVYLVNV